jgi:hypothetical protein
MAIYSNLDDNDLLLLVKQGQEAAFTEIYHRYWERLVATGYYYTRTKQAAEEIVNDVLMGLWLRREGLVIRSLSAYLGTAVKFAVFKAMARKKRREEILAGHATHGESHNETEQQLDARWVQYVNGLEEKTIFIGDDEFTDGLTIRDQLNYNNDTNDPNRDIKTGDTVRVDMLCLDAAVYKYWYSLNTEASGNGSANSPGNPISNINGGCLGYFSAQTVRSKTLVVQK